MTAAQRCRELNEDGLTPSRDELVELMVEGGFPEDLAEVLIDDGFDAFVTAVGLTRH